MGVLDRFRVQTPSPNLMGAVKEIETAMARLRTSTDELEGLLERMSADGGALSVTEEERIP